MADKMTLEQVLAEMLSCRGCDPDYVNEITRRTFDRWTDALDAHLAAMGEPVAPGVSSLLALVAKWRRLGNADVAGNIWGQCADELSALIPPASGDWDKVRGVIIDLRRDSALLARDLTSENDLLDMADKLTAALPEAKP